MARARSIKPGILKNELLGQGDPLLFPLFCGLWMLADREGRLEDRPARIRIEVLPYREGIDIDALIDELQNLDFIDRYSVDGVRLIQVKKFSEHQSPHKNEVASTLPARPQVTESKEAPSEPEALRPMDEVVPPTDDALGLTADCGPPDCGLLTADHLDSERLHRVAVSSSPREPIDYLRHLTLVHGYDELRTRTRQGNIVQARQWLDDGVTFAELDDAVTISRRQLAANDDERDPPIAYLAPVLASNRRQTAAVPAGIAAETREQRVARMVSEAEEQYGGDPLVALGSAS